MHPRMPRFAQEFPGCARFVGIDGVDRQVGAKSAISHKIETTTQKAHYGSEMLKNDRDRRNLGHPLQNWCVQLAMIEALLNRGKGKYT